MPTDGRTNAGFCNRTGVGVCAVPARESAGHTRHAGSRCRHTVAPRAARRWAGPCTLQSRGLRPPAGAPEMLPAGNAQRRGRAGSRRLPAGLPSSWGCREGRPGGAARPQKEASVCLAGHRGPAGAPVPAPAPRTPRSLLCAAEAAAARLRSEPDSDGWAEALGSCRVGGGPLPSGHKTSWTRRPGPEREFRAASGQVASLLNRALRWLFLQVTLWL